MVFCYSYVLLCSLALHEAKYQVPFCSLLLRYTIVLRYSIAQIDTSPPSFFFQVLKFVARGLGCWNYKATSLEEAWRQQAPN